MCDLTTATVRSMPVPKENKPDQRRIVARLAREFHKPVDEVAKLYEGERAQLEIGARLAKFPHIFAIRNVEGILRQRGIEKLAVLAASRPPLAA